MGVTRLLLLEPFYTIQTNFMYFFAHDCTYFPLLLIAYLVSITLNASLVGLEEGKRGRRKLLSSSYLVGHPENFLSELQQEDQGSLANLVGKAYIYRQLAVRYIGRFVYSNLAS